MYGGQPPPHPHQFQQHARHSFDASNGVPEHTVMDASDFGSFSFPFQDMQELGTMMIAQEQPSNSSPDAFSQPLNAAQAPQSSVEVVAPRASIDAGKHPRKPSVTPSIDLQPERRSSTIAESLDDPVADEFELTGNGRADGTDLGSKAKKVDKADATPSWSELKTKAGKDRKRLPLACIACRRKKIRCSGEKPACKHCLRSRIPCVYKVTTRKAAPRTDYMAMLDKRLKRMEERIIKVIPKADQDTTPKVTRAVVKPAIPGMPSGAKSGPKKRGADEAFGAGLEAWARGPGKTEAGGDDTASPSALQEADESQLFLEGSDALPSKEIQEHLAEVYFDNVYGQAYHLLHKPSYMRRLKNDALPPVLVLSVCAVAARFSSSPKLTSTTRHFLRGEEWAAPARDICTKRYESPNVTILTCLIILGLHEFGTCQGGRSWALGGQAIRMAFALQLHKDLEFDPMSRNGQTKLSFVDREIRRRIMWSCFLMDRFNSSGTERPMFIKEDTMKIPLPVKERHFQLDMPAVTETLNGSVPPTTSAGVDAAGDARENLGVAAFMIRAVALWGRIVTYVSQGAMSSEAHSMRDPASGFSKLVKEAEEFATSLPEPLCYSPDNLALHQNHNTTNQYILLHLIVQQNILFLFRSAALPPSGQPMEFTAVARSKALEAAGRVSECFKDAEEARVMISAPFAGYCAFVSTTMHIWGTVSGDASVKATAESNSTTNIRFLRRMMKYWGMFYWMEEDIRSQYRVALDRSRSGMPPEDCITPGPVLQYGDWFNRYPHGVSDADFMDPAAQKQKDKIADGVLEQKPELQSVEEFFTTLASPKAKERMDGVQPAGPKRKTTKKAESGSAKIAQQQQPPPKLDMAAVKSHTQPGISSQTAPRTAHPIQKQHQQRRPSAPLLGQHGSPATFHPAVSNHPQAAAYHSMSPISPANVDHFQGQPGFYPQNIMPMGMTPQSSTMLQPLDQQLSFGAYSMDDGNVHNGQQLMNGVQGWGGAPGGQQLQGQAVANSMSMAQPAHASDQQAQSTVNGIEAEGWYMSFDMQHPEMSSNMGMAAHNPDAFNPVFANNGMASQNPLGGLRHSQ